MRSDYSSWREELVRSISAWFHMCHHDAEAYVSACGEDVWIMSHEYGLSPDEVAEEEFVAARDMMVW